jgi:hexosaminidase
MNKIFTTFFIFLCLFTNSQCRIIPNPVSYIENTGYFFSANIVIDSTQISKNNLIFFNDEINNRFRKKIELDATKNNLEFEKISHAKLDYYKIEIDKKIKISYTNERSCFYAINSLLQQLEQDEKTYLIARKCVIEDYPKFEWRGLHLDVSRHFFTVEEVKRFLDLMAYYKFNTFHWHLTDDQGWRIEIKKYPKLTEIGAWRDSTVNKHYSTKPRTYKVQKYGGFYTQEQIKEVVKYSQQKHINVVPEIELPGHSRAALAAYPEFSCTGIQQNVPGLWGIFDDIYCSKKETISFLKDILTEVLELFPSEYIHIGGDEAPKTRWKNCEKCQKVIKENNLKDEHELQSYVIRQMDEFLTAKGRKLIGWDEILEGGLSPNATVMSWRGFEGGIDAVKQNHAVVMSPGSHCYFDHYQSENPNEPLAIGGYTPLEKVYEFNPIPAGLNNEQESLILGGQANVWTEYIPDFKQVEYMVYPRALALSQVLWSENKPNYQTFETSLIKYHFPFLKSKQVNFSSALFYPKLTISDASNKIGVHFESKNENKTIIFDRQDYNKSTKKNIEFQGQEFPFTFHFGIGTKVEFETLPHEKYRSNYKLCLVDGIIGKRPWNGKEWLGFNEDTISFKITLDKVEKISTITLSLLEDNGSWIYLPQKVICSISEDGQNWKSIEVKEIKELTKINVTQKLKQIQFELYTIQKIPENTEGAGNKPWTFIDEVLLEN